MQTELIFCCSLTRHQNTRSRKFRSRNQRFAVKQQRRGVSRRRGGIPAPARFLYLRPP